MNIKKIKFLLLSLILTNPIFCWEEKELIISLPIIDRENVRSINLYDHDPITFESFIRVKNLKLAEVKTKIGETVVNHYFTVKSILDYMENQLAIDSKFEDPLNRQEIVAISCYSYNARKQKFNYDEKTTRRLEERFLDLYMAIMIKKCFGGLT